MSADACAIACQTYVGFLQVINSQLKEILNQDKHLVEAVK